MCWLWCVVVLGVKSEVCSPGNSLSQPDPLYSVAGDTANFTDNTKDPQYQYQQYYSRYSLLYSLIINNLSPFSKDNRLYIQCYNLMQLLDLEDKGSLFKIVVQLVKKALLKTLSLKLFKFWFQVQIHFDYKSVAVSKK